MNVLHVIPSVEPRIGGPAIAVAGLAIAQRALGMGVEVFSNALNTDDDSLMQRMMRGAVSVSLGIDAQNSAPSDISNPSALEASIKRADVIHIHALWEPIQHQAAVIARQHRVPYIFRPCGMLDPWSLNQGKWKKRLYLAWRLRRDLNNAAAIHFTAETERDLTAPLKLRPPAIVEPNGIDITEFDPLPPRGAFRAKYPQLGDRPIVLFLSRLHPKKGLDILIPAFAAGAPRESMLILTGPCSDEYRQELEQLIQKHDLASRVVWTGMLRGRERIEAYVDADLFCLPSYQENFGIVVVEALAAGTPVLISDQVNIWREIVAGGAGGVTPAKAEPLAKEIANWMTNDVQRRSAATHARDFVINRYTWDAIARHWAEHYQMICGEKRK